MIEKLAIVTNPTSPSSDGGPAAPASGSDEQRQEQHLRADEHAAGAPAVDQHAADQRAHGARREHHRQRRVAAASDDPSSTTKYAGMNAWRPK